MDHPDIVEAETAKTLASMTQISEVLIGKKDANKEANHSLINSTQPSFDEGKMSFNRDKLIGVPAG